MAQTENVLELEQFEANSFMGISADKPIIVDFTKMKKNQNIVEFTGDEGTGKSSTIAGILYAMGAAFDLKKEKLFNSKDKAIDVNLKFTYNGEQYHVIASSSRVELKKLNESGKWKSEDSPVSVLKKIFGPVSLSPFGVKLMKGKDQIEFFQNMFGTGEDASKKMRKLEADIENIFQARRDVNREIKAISSALGLEPLFQDYEASQKRFKTTVSAEKEKKAFDDATKANQQYEKNAEALSDLKEDLKDKKQEIADLKKKLAESEAEEKNLNTRVTNGEKWLSENKNVPKEFEKANKEWMNLSQTLADYEKWKGILKKEKELIERQDAATTATGQLDDLREKLLKLTKECLPKVEGLTIKVAAGLDKTDQPEGVFYFDQPIHELSQSEYEGMWAKIFAESGCNFLFFENLNNFGSNTQGILNSLAKEGAMIFGTRTNPSVKEMGVSFKTKVE